MCQCAYGQPYDLCSNVVSKRLRCVINISCGPVLDKTCAHVGKRRSSDSDPRLKSLVDCPMNLLGITRSNEWIDCNPPNHSHAACAAWKVATMSAVPTCVCINGPERLPNTSVAIAKNKGQARIAHHWKQDKAWERQALYKVFMHGVQGILLPSSLPIRLLF